MELVSRPDVEELHKIDVMDAERLFAEGTPLLTKARKLYAVDLHGSSV